VTDDESDTSVDTHVSYVITNAEMKSKEETICCRWGKENSNALKCDTECAEKPRDAKRPHTNPNQK